MPDVCVNWYWWATRELDSKWKLFFNKLEIYNIKNIIQNSFGSKWQESIPSSLRGKKKVEIYLFKKITVQK
jgi:hypothetical protein